MVENKYNLIANSKLHDYKLCDINVSYNKAMINMFLNNSKGKEVVINFEDFSIFKISHEEKWGWEHIYVRHLLKAMPRIWGIV